MADASGWQPDDEIACDACGVCMPAALDPARIERAIDGYCAIVLTNSFAPLLTAIFKWDRCTRQLFIALPDNTTNQSCTGCRDREFFNNIVPNRPLRRAGRWIQWQQTASAFSQPMGVGSPPY